MITFFGSLGAIQITELYCIVLYISGKASKHGIDIIIVQIIILPLGVKCHMVHWVASVEWFVDSVEWFVDPVEREVASVEWFAAFVEREVAFVQWQVASAEDELANDLDSASLPPR